MTDEREMGEAGPLVLLIGCEIEPVGEVDAFTTTTAFAALREAMPTSISYEGNLGTVSSVWLVTPDMLEALLDGRNADEHDQAGDDDDEGDAAAPVE